MGKEHLEILLENIDKKFDIVIEGYSTLDRKIDDLSKKTEERFDLIDFKIETIAADLKAHRQDTEAHHSIYRVKES